MLGENRIEDLTLFYQLLSVVVVVIACSFSSSILW